MELLRRAHITGVRSLMFSSKILIQAAAILTLSSEVIALPRIEIIGGVVATPGEFPSIVELIDHRGKHLCGGTLIRHDWVLTAGHCLGAVKTVVTGLNSGDLSIGAESFQVEKEFEHPNHQHPISSSNDYALLKLSGPSRSPVLRVNNESLSFPDDEARSPRALIAGWGSQAELSHSKLQGREHRATKSLMWAEVALVSARRCAAFYKRRFDPLTMICAGSEIGGKDACDGDSGGPLILRAPDGTEVLVGLTSWGDGCGRPHAFGVYSRVDAVFDWIEKTIREN